MTGFGTADGVVGAMRVTVELRSVNHRFFSPAIKLPSALARWEGEVREAIRARVARGHVTATVRAEARAGQAASIDEVAFANTVERLRALKARHVLAGDVDLATVLRVPGVVVVGEDSVAPDAADSLLGIVAAAIEALLASRLGEGARLGAIVDERLRVVEEVVARIAERAPARILAHREKLRATVRELAGGAAIDEQRLAQEIGLLAERVDVGEELDRFRAHLAAFRDTLHGSTGGPIGKRLGFLLQEMLREANTAGSKANDAAMQHDVVALKEELERIREQVENLE